MNYLDRILNTVPMYRLTLYYVAFLWMVAIALGFLGMLPYTGLAIAASGIFLLFVAFLTNEIFAWAFDAPTNHESVYITALILALIMAPAQTAGGLLILMWVAILAIASKFILAIGKKHVFNPAAIAAVITGITIGGSASWWIGTLPLLPFVLLGGLILMRKVQRSDLIMSFIATVIVLAMGHSLLLSQSIATTLIQVIVHSALFFLAFVMLTEPLTTPPTKVLRVVYGVIVGILFLPFVHIGNLYLTPELALVIGNLFSYIVSPKQKAVLTLARIVRHTDDLYDFHFLSKKPLAFTPGQYMEWTLGSVPFDSRGNRRYFTIASSPGEREIHLGIRIQEPASAFKKKLLSLKPGDTIVASQRAGEFVLPRNRKKKLVFIAGGIGITPFRSMVQHLIDTRDVRDITLLYSVKRPKDFIYTEVFEKARARLGMRTVYHVNAAAAPRDWGGRSGRITPQSLREDIPDYRERYFYISGPQGMVEESKKLLTRLGVPRSQIRTDYFPGFT